MADINKSLAERELHKLMEGDLADGMLGSDFIRYSNWLTAIVETGECDTEIGKDQFLARASAGPPLPDEDEGHQAEAYDPSSVVEPIFWISKVKRRPSSSWTSP
jgi:hypothetical protein